MTARPAHAVVVGAGVAGLAAAWTFARAGVRVTVLERAGRVGGLVESERPEPGILVEHGADGLLADKAGGLDVLAALGLADRLVRGGRAPRRALVWTADGLADMPPGLFAFERRALGAMLRSPLLSRRAKARLLLEPLVPRAAADESVGAFFARRFGHEVRDRLVAPLLRGIYGAPPEALAMRAVFPTLAAYEARYRSLGVALLVAPRRRGGVGLVTLRDGMASIPRALATSLGDAVHLGVGVHGLALAPGRLRVLTTGCGTIDADAVVVATPVAAAAALIASVAPAAADALGDVAASDAEVVTLAFARGQVEHPLDATGFVVGAPGRAMLACTFASEKWDGRAPDDVVVLRAVLARVDGDDAALAAQACGELRPVLGLRGAPRWWRVRRRRAALPVLAPGQAARIADGAGDLAARGPIALAGNYLGGIGVPDAIASGIVAATRLLGAASGAPARQAAMNSTVKTTLTTS